MNTHTYTLPAAIVALTISTIPVLTSCANTKQMSPQAKEVVAKLKEAAQSIDVEHLPGGACGEFIEQLRELSEGAGKECREVLRQVMADRGGA